MKNYWQEMFNQQILWLFFLIILQLISKKRIKFFPTQGFRAKLGMIAVLSGLLIGQGMLWLAPYFPRQQAVEQLGLSTNWYWPALALIGLGPLVEEIFFRGLLGNFLLNRFSFWPAACGNGLIFAAFHGGGWLLLPFTLAGMVLFWLFYRERAIFYPWLAHTSWNLLVFFAYWQ
ncbi:CPBP family intramembrane glutamic endopeptidase [Carboxydocella sp. ULO1]|uniref:CPBP family intramembrane glutamic endopeptidase n=1 Tax=Carboxydocella sp. ULO1 TaxID=1926599 RepID=UPI0009AD7BA7|nr:CPBP family intramembrane glutamic endopeptidase [Carboxydocella sp. ULO1]AVX31705.1 CAAX protease self-immunity [Carboxydocella thermautotrophica]